MKAWRRLSAACDDGFVVNLEQRRGMPGKYRATAESAKSDAILPTAATFYFLMYPRNLRKRATRTKILIFPKQITVVWTVAHRLQPLQPLQPMTLTGWAR
jgi:hypothetical protein